MPSPDENRFDAPRSGWERHLQTIFSAIAVALLLWVYSVVQRLDVSVAVQTEQIKTLSMRFDTFNSNQYSAANAASDFSERDRLIYGLQLSLESIEEELDSMRKTK